MPAIVALNCGSSSIKAAVLRVPGFEREIELRAENIGTHAKLTVDAIERPVSASADLRGVAERVLAEIASHSSGSKPRAVVHRVVHGGERFSQPTLIDDAVLAALDDVGSLASLHNPPALQVIREARRTFPATPHYAVFDTGFHSTLPPHAREYAISQELRRRHDIRRFGFHGINHAHVMGRVATILGVAPQALRIISCHLGNGASVCAIECGRSVETSMGMTPLEGLVMGTRCGDIDPGVLLELMRDYDREALEQMLNRESGMRGLTGTNDLRAIEDRARDGEESCQLALDVYAHRVRKYIGAYAAVMGGVDAIVFTGGIGENSAAMRQRCLQRLGFLGAVLDEDRNRNAFEKKDGTDFAVLAHADSRVALFAVRADEERAMVQAIATLLD